MKRITFGLIICLVLTMSFVQFSDSKDNEMSKVNVVYVFDPLCGWCYGFEPVMIKFQEEYKDKINLEVIPGGMVSIKNAQPLANMRSFLMNAIPSLEKRTGIKIGQAYYDSILNKDGVVLNSELPSQAFLGALNHYKGREVVLAKEIQDLLYQKGKDISKVEAFSSIKGLEIDSLNSENLTLKMNQAFTRSKQLGVTGYPAVLSEYQGKYYQLTSGYTDYDNLAKVTDKFLKKINEGKL
jgi:putative protein-disulfide isomerase